MIQSVEQEGSWVLPQFSWVLPQVLIVLEHVKISSMGYASVVCLVGKRSTFSKYTQSALMHRPCLLLSTKPKKGNKGQKVQKVEALFDPVETREDRLVILGPSAVLLC